MFTSLGISKKVLALLLVGVMSVGLLTGCGGQKKDASTDTKQNTPAKAEDSMVRITGSFPLYTDPGVGSNAIEAAALFNLYDPLVFPTLDGKIVPHLATDWTISPDGLTYTFNLRKGVKFHDGSEVNADDVAFSMNRLLALGTGFAYLYTPYVKDAVVVDADTVQINMKKPFGPFISSVVRFYVLNKDLVEQHLAKTGPYGKMADYGKEWLISNDAGSGPYQVQEMKMSEYMVAKKYRDYWRGWEENANAPEYFKVINSSDPVTVRMLMSTRELEMTDEWQATENLDSMDQLDGVDLTNFNTGVVCNIELNTKKAPTDDIHFRKALAYLMDYQTVITQIVPGTKQSRGPVSSAYQGFDDTLYQYTFNKEKALEELKQSKYYDKLAQYTVGIVWSADVPDEEKIALLLQANAKELGIKVEVLKTPWVSMIKMAESIESTESGTIVLPSDSYNEAGSVLALRYHSNTSGTFTQYEWLKDPQIDAGIEKAFATTDKAARFQIYKELQQKIVDMCPTIFVYEYPEKRAYQSAYLSWLAVDYQKEGKLNCPIMGRLVYMPEIKIFPEKKAELLKK